MMANKFVNLKLLNKAQISQYRHAITKAFPQIISESQVIKNNWTKLETYFPEYQHFLLSNKGDLIGFINTIPFHFQNALSKLPDNGWDWMFEKGINDYEHNIEPNNLGGLQVIVRSKFKKQGYSKEILNFAKTHLHSSRFENLIIPIRPTRKHEFPQMTMASYLELKQQDKIYDPWIRTHVKSGAEIIKICSKSMTMKGDLMFWESMLNRKIDKSGNYKLKGALELVSIDLENNTGQYVEPNIWIKYS